MKTERVPLQLASTNGPLQLGAVSVELSDEERLESAMMANQLVGDDFRCPEGLLDFQLTGKLSDDSGYFRFGPDITCFGRSCSGIRRIEASATLDDLVGGVEIEDGIVKLPFDPTEVIDNLRLERYVKNPGRLQELLRRLYYTVRPMATSSLRRKVQRFNARNWREISFPQWPVDTTVETLSEQLMSYALRAKDVERIPFVWFWPGGARGCVSMTHDVETAAGQNYCGELMDLDDAAGIKASFQIVPEQRYPVSPGVLNSIRHRGFEVGIQDLDHDGRLFDRKGEFIRRAQAINRYGREYGARGFRAAVLYRNPEWFELLAFDYDMSIPNVAHLDPQRGGCCTVRPFFIGNMIELPVTTTQDYTLFYLLRQHSIDLWKSQTESILGKHGLASFIVHPDYLVEPELKDLYLQLLQYLRLLRESENVWVALPGDVASWWRARSQMSVQREGSTWRIAGEGADRAVLAFAELEDGRLVYRVGAAAAECSSTSGSIRRTPCSEVSR